MEIAEKVKKSALAIVIVGIPVALLFGAYHPLEPRYQGRCLSQWADTLAGPSERDAAPKMTTEATHAIRHIGTRALPYAIQWCQAPEPAQSGPLPDCLEKGMDFLVEITRRVGVHLPPSAYDLHNRGDAIFYSLGPDAKPAIPVLIGLLESKDPSVVNAAWFGLDGIGPTAGAPMTSALTNVNVQVRRGAASFFQSLDRATPSTVPALVLCLGDQDFEVRARAAWSLALIGTNAPSIIVPVLLDTLKNETDPQQKMSFVRALGRFGTNARVAAPVLEEILELQPPTSYPERTEWSTAMYALNSIDPDAAKPFIETWNASQNNSLILRDPRRRNGNSKN